MKPKIINVFGGIVCLIALALAWYWFDYKLMIVIILSLWGNNMERFKLQVLTEAPRTQIDEDIVADVKKFMSEQHTVDEKYDFIQNIANEPLNMVTDKMGVGRITPFVQKVCDLDAIFKPENFDKLLNAREKLIPKEGEYVAYGWDGKPFIAKDKSDESRISVQSIVDNQAEDKQENMLVKIMEYMDDLMWAGKFDVVDDFIKEFCRHDICFQYCLCLLTCAMWAKDKLKNREMLIGKTKKKGIEEIGEKDTMSCLSGLL